MNPQENTCANCTAPRSGDHTCWNGVDRRHPGDDRRQCQIPFYCYNQLYGQPYVPQPIPQPIQSLPPTAVATTPDSKNVANTTLTLQQIGGIVVVVGSILISGFSAWSNLNRELDLQKNNLVQFKTSIEKTIEGVDNSTKELKKLTETMQAQNQKANEELNRQIQSLDSSVTQLYQKVSAK